MSIQDDIKMYLQYKEDLAELEDQVSTVKSRIRELETEIIQQMGDDGIAGMKIDGKSIGINRRLRAGAKAEFGGIKGLVEMFNKHNMAEMCTETVSAARLGSWVSDYDPEGMLSEDQIRRAMIEGGVPDEIAEALHIYEQFSLSVRKG